MNDIKFMRECCKYTDWFKICKMPWFNDLGYREYLWCKMSYEHVAMITRGPFYSLLLQKAIEGVNASVGFTITLYSMKIEVNGLKFYHDAYESIDECKRAVLEYIFKYKEEEKDKWVK